MPPRRPTRGEIAGLAAVLVAALVLRLVGIRAGLPGPGLLSPDEDTVVPKALAMLEGGTLDPGWFLYPTLYLSLLAGALGVVGMVLGGPDGIPFASEAAYRLDPAPYILTGRALSVVAGIGLVAATWALGRRAYGPAPGLVAAAGVAVSPLAVAYSRVAVTDMAMTALLATGLWLLVGAAGSGGRRRLLAAAVLLGLATSAKYNAGLAVLPLLGVAAVTARRRGASWRRSARDVLAPAAAWLGAFLAGTPFAALDPATFVGDFVRQSRIVADGWLGFETAPPGWVHNLHPVLSGSVGAGLAVLGAAGVVLALTRRRTPDLVLAPFAVVYFAYVSTWNAHFDRYLLPLVPVLAVLGARAGVEAARAARRRGRPAVAGAAVAGLAVALVIPAAEAGALLAGYQQRDLRLDARALVGRHVPVGAYLATDPLGPPLVGREVGVRLAASGHRTRWYDLVRLETPRPGGATDRRRDVAALRRGGIRWVVTSDSIRDRVLAAPGTYPVEVRFYRDLRRTARRLGGVPASLGPGVQLWDLARRPRASPRAPGCRPPGLRVRSPECPTAPPWRRPE